MLHVIKKWPASKYAGGLFLLSSLLVITHHFYFFYGYFGYDDLHYAKLSYHLLEGKLDFSDHYSYRWPVLGLTALSYALFGVSDFATALPALLLSCGLLGLICWTLRRDVFALSVTLLCFFSVRWNVFYTDKLMPDLYVSFFLFVAWCAWQKLSAGDRYRQLWYSGCFTGGLLLAFLAKGTVILIVPLLLFLLVDDIRQRKVAKWKISFLMGPIMLIGYFLLTWHLAGHPLARFQAIDDNSYFNACSYGEMPMAATVERVTYGFFQLIREESLIVFLLFALGVKACTYWWKPSGAAQREVNFYCHTILLLFLSMNFMTISLSTYNPACLDIRHYLFAVPILSVSTGKILQTFRLSRWAKGGILLFALINLQPIVAHWQYARSLNYAATKADVQQVVQQFPDSSATIVANQVMINLIDFYRQYQPGAKLLPLAKYNAQTCQDRCFLVSNWYTSFHAGTTTEQGKQEILKTTGTTLIPRSAKGLRGVEIYQIGNSTE